MRQPKIRQAFMLLAIIGTLGVLTACGQKGPLYMPDPATQSEEAKDKKADN